MPDLMVLQPTKGFYGLFIEMKTNIGIMSIKQTALSKQLNDKGYLCLIARSANEGIKLIEDYLRVVDNQSNTQKINKLSVN